MPSRSNREMQTDKPLEAAESRFQPMRPARPLRTPLAALPLHPLRFAETSPEHESDCRGVREPRGTSREPESRSHRSTVSSGVDFDVDIAEL